MIIHGAGGMGKTRLAQEFVKERKETGWDGGFLAPESLEHLVNHDRFDNWGPIMDTLVVVDYAAGKAENLKKLMSLAVRWAKDDAQFPKNSKLRMLLLERHGSIDDGWVAEIFASIGKWN